MTQRYFLGANSARGFISLYEDFPPDREAMLHIIKSGPGTGKSGFMGRISRAAVEKGMDVHYVLCSGDPDSLDGVYLPERREAWVDGTAPHALEPRVYGADADYLHLGQFFYPLDNREKTDARRLSREYKGFYQIAYQALASLADLYPTAASKTPEIPGALLSLLPEGGADKPGQIRRRFLHAISCQGELYLDAEAQQLCRGLIPLDPHGDPETLDALTKEAVKRGLDVILCPSPLMPERAELLLIPALSLGFSSGAWPPASQANPRHAALMSQALDALKTAKKLHDELEDIYKSHMDFAALSAFTEDTIRSHLG